MTLKTFTLKFSWRLVVMHLLACWFFIHAFNTASYAFFPKIVEAARQSSDADTRKFLNDNLVQTFNMGHFIFWTGVSGFIGMLIAFIISLIITKKHSWYWGNSLIVFIVAYILYRFGLFGWGYFKLIFWSPGEKLIHSISLEFIINSIILLGIGLFIFFSKYSNRFIEKKYSAVY
jgi:MFS family permease